MGPIKIDAFGLGQSLLSVVRLALLGPQFLQLQNGLVLPQSSLLEPDAGFGAGFVKGLVKGGTFFDQVFSQRGLLTLLCKHLGCVFLNMLENPSVELRGVGTLTVVVVARGHLRILVFYLGNPVF